MASEYELKVAEAAWQSFFDDMPYVRKVHLIGEAPHTELVVDFRHPQSGARRQLRYGIYEKALNATGHDNPVAVGQLIAIHVQKEAEAKR
jgi:hypothetical protein